MRNDALSVVSKLAASPNNVFTTRQAADHGLTRRHLRAAIAAGAIQEVHPGVFVGGSSPPTWLQRVAGAAAAAPGATASHRCAGRLHRLDGMVDPAVELTAIAPSRIRLSRVVGHRVHALDPGDIVTIAGIRTTNLARTLCDLGSVCEEADVERAFDDVVRRGTSTRWLRFTAERLVRPNAPGAGLVLRLLDLHDARGTVRDSWFERLVERCLRHPELADLVIQHRLCDEAGTVVARFDLAVPSAQLGIEGHSRRHHFGAVGEASDEHRDNAAGRLGWDVMYIGYGDVRSPATVLDEVLGRVRARRRQLGAAS